MKNYDLNQVIFLLKNSLDLNHPDLNRPTRFKLKYLPSRNSYSLSWV